MPLAKRKGLLDLIASTNLFVAGFELDAYRPSLRFAVELDTYDYHDGPSEFEADRLRRLLDQRRRELQLRPIRE